MWIRNRLLGLLVILPLLSACACRVTQPPRPVEELAPLAKQATASIAKPHRGLDILGLPKQNVPMIAKTIRPGTMIGLFADKTFGPGALQALETLLKTGKVIAFRAHLYWTSHVTPKNSVVAVKTASAAVEGLHKRYPATECYVSPICEYNERDAKLIAQWAKAIEAAAPSCKVVLTPSGTGAVVAGYPVERHGNSAHAYGVSNDGAILWDSNSAAFRNAGTEYVLGWWLRSNLSTAGPIVNPPSARKAQIPQADILQASAILFDAPPLKPAGNPPGCKTVRDVGMELVTNKKTGKQVWVATKELWKTNGEDYGNGDVRGNKPLLISRSRSKRMAVITPAGKEVACLKYYDTYTPYGPGWYRAYMGSCSGDSPASLLGKLGGEWGYVKDGGTCILINAVRRLGSYR